MYVKVHPSEEYMSSSAKQFPKTLLRKLAVLLRCKRFLHEPRTDQAAGFKDRLQQACRSSRHKQHFQQRLLLADFLLSSSAQERESDPTGRAPTAMGILGASPDCRLCCQPATLPSMWL